MHKIFLTIFYPTNISNVKLGELNEPKSNSNNNFARTKVRRKKCEETNVGQKCYVKINRKITYVKNY